MESELEGNQQCNVAYSVRPCRGVGRQGFYLKDGRTKLLHQAGIGRCEDTIGQGLEFVGTHRRMSSTADQRRPPAEAEAQYYQQAKDAA